MKLLPCFVLKKDHCVYYYCECSNKQYKYDGNDYKPAFKDPRFPALQANETQGLSLSISTLSPATPTSFKDEADLRSQFRPNINDLTIADQGQCAVFLAKVWEDILGPQTFLMRLKQKVGLTPDHCSDSFQANRFTTLSITPAGAQAATVKQPDKLTGFLTWSNSE